jgi:hypothetical protein
VLTVQQQLLLLYQLRGGQQVQLASHLTYLNPPCHSGHLQTLLLLLLLLAPLAS